MKPLTDRQLHAATAAMRPAPKPVYSDTLKLPEHWGDKRTPELKARWDNALEMHKARGVAIAWQSRARAAVKEIPLPATVLRFGSAVK